METVCWLQIPHYVCRVSHVVSGLSAIWTGIYTRRDEFCLGALSRLCQQKVFMTLWKSDRHILRRVQLVSSCFYDIQLGELVPGLGVPKQQGSSPVCLIL